MVSDEYLWFAMYAAMTFMLLLCVVLMVGGITKGRTAVGLTTFVAFICGLYLGTGSLLGRPKPIIDLPIGWDDMKIQEDHIKIIGGYIGATDNYLLAATESGIPRYYKLANLAELTGELKRTMSLTRKRTGNSWGFYLNPKKLNEKLKNLKKDGSQEDRMDMSGIFQAPPPQERLEKPEQTEQPNIQEL